MVKGILVNRKSDEVLKSQLKMEHADLVAEMQTVENLPTHERLQLARLRRTQQLKVARQKEKEWLKSQRAKGNNTITVNGSTTTTTHHFRSASGRHIAFENSVVLLEAASRNDMEEVAELLQHGITPDAANEDGLTALHQCCIDNNVEMLRLLLQYGANVDAQDSDKWTPLHAAATCGHLDLVRILIEHGANLLAVNTDGNMPYDLCDDENTLDFIEAEMSKRGVTQELIDETRSSTEKQMLRDLMEIARNGGDLEEPDYQGATPLHIASANGYSRVVEFLLEMHANVDALDKDLWSPVHAAACWGHLEVLEMLAQCGADLNVKNKDDETPSDICEDPEIRERIEQLKTEQESKRLAEAQRRRVRRSQSNNTRAQSVRRTSLRDKTLTTKKDAVEEARLRLQAQEVFIAPDSTTVELSPNGGASMSTATNVEPSSTHDTHIKRNSSEMNGGINWTKGPTTTQTTGSTTQTTSTTNQITTIHHNNNNNLTNNNNNHNTNNNNNNDKKSYNASLALNNGSILSHSLSADAIDSTTTHSFPIPRRPPDGKENDDELMLNTYKIGGSSISSSGGEHQRSTSLASTAVIVADRNTSTSAAEAVQIQSSKDAANGKINVQVTVLVDTTSTHHHHHQLHNPSQALPPQLETTFSGATLANLKKQRSQSRSCVLNENGSVLGAVTNTTTSAGTTNNNNGIDGTTTISNQPISSGLNPSLMDSSAGDMNSSYSVNKFSGVTGDVVSDSTSSKKCCVLM